MTQPCNAISNLEVCMPNHALSNSEPCLGSREGGHLDLFRFVRFLSICSDLRCLFSEIPRFVPICSDFFRSVPIRGHQRNSLSPDPFCKYPTNANDQISKRFFRHGPHLAGCFNYIAAKHLCHAQPDLTRTMLPWHQDRC